MAPMMKISGLSESGEATACVTVGLVETGTTENKVIPAGTAMNPPSP